MLPGLPGLSSPGLIEAPAKIEVIYSPAGVFRGYLAPASLKPGVGRRLLRLRDVFRGYLAPASLKLSIPL